MDSEKCVPTKRMLCHKNYTLTVHYLLKQFSKCQNQPRYSMKFYVTFTVHGLVRLFDLNKKCNKPRRVPLPKATRYSRLYWHSYAEQVKWGRMFPLCRVSYMECMEHYYYSDQIMRNRTFLLFRVDYTKQSNSDVLNGYPRRLYNFWLANF